MIDPVKLIEVAGIASMRHLQNNKAALKQIKPALRSAGLEQVSSSEYLLIKLFIALSMQLLETIIAKGIFEGEQALKKEGEAKTEPETVVNDILTKVGVENISALKKALRDGADVEVEGCSDNSN